MCGGAYSHFLLWVERIPIFLLWVEDVPYIFIPVVGIPLIHFKDKKSATL